MRLRRVPRESQFFDLFIELAGHLQSSALILAELSGIPAQDRREAASRLQEHCDAADASAGAVLRRLRENYVTPFDREDLFLLSDSLRDTCHRIDTVGYAMATPAFADMPTGVLDMIAILTGQADATLRMTQRLRGKPDQWEYVESVDRFYQRAVGIQQRVSDAVPASRHGLTHLSAMRQLAEAFVQCASAFRDVGRVVGVIAVKES